MSKAVIVLEFEDPDNAIDTAVFVATAKAAFADTPGMRMHLAIRGAAKEILNVVGSAPKSNLVDHARRELTLLDEDDETISGYLRVIQAFADMGHSGGSAAVAVPVVNKLLQFKNLTPLTDAPTEWSMVMDGSSSSKRGLWQNTRNSEAFSNDAGRRYYLLSENGSFARPETLHESKKHDE